MSRWPDRPRPNARNGPSPWRDFADFQTAVASAPLRAEWTLVGAGVMDPGVAAAAYADQGLSSEMFADPQAAAAMAYIVEHRSDEMVNAFELAQVVDLPPTVVEYACEQLATTRHDAANSARQVRRAAAHRALLSVMDTLRAEIAAGNGPWPESLARLAEAAQRADPLDEDRRLRIEDGAAAATRPLPPPDTVLADCFEMGDKVDIVAPSKSRKTWFAVGLAVHLAAGREFLGMAVPKPRRVLYVNLEIKRDDFDRRLQRTLQAYGIDAADIGERLGLMSARGKGPEIRQRIIALARRWRAEVVVIDPQYKLLKPEEDENAGSGIADILRLKDNIAEETGAAVIAVMHDGKGVSGDRDIRDRGAGSSIRSGCWSSPSCAATTRPSRTGSSNSPTGGSRCGPAWQRRRRQRGRGRRRSGRLRRWRGTRPISTSSSGRSAPVTAIPCPVASWRNTSPCSSHALNPTRRTSSRHSRSVRRPES